MKLRTLLLAGLASVSMILPASALTLEVDGVDRTEEAQTTLVQGVTYVSLRAAAAMLDGAAEVSWDGTAARVTTSQLELRAKPGDAYIQANGRCIAAQGAIQAENGVTMTPLRALADAMGGTVTWDQATQTARVTTGSGVPSPANYNAEDLYWLSRIISAESKGEPLAGKIAVGNVVLNRVASSEFPNTVKGVIFDARWGGQFTPVQNGTIYDEPTAESVTAAKLCLEGVSEVGDSLYFLAPSLAQNNWSMENREFVATIGNHWFYR